MENEVLPFFWFNEDIEKVFQYYKSIFPKSTILSASPSWGRMKINQFEFMALNGGDHYKFSPAISLFVSCKTQKEVDFFWENLSAGGSTLKCGWLQDKFGVSWQVVPEILGSLLGDQDREKANRARAAMMQMEKLDIKMLQDAHRGG